MQVNKITFTHLYQKVKNTPNYQNNKSSNAAPKDNDSIKSSIAYRDYNINFGARLYRTPANFYAQKFNQDHMPLTMRNYLHEDFEERQNMPPEQLMREAFIDLKYIDSLDIVPRTSSFKDEPLFKELTNTPNRKAMKGVVSEIEALKDIMDEIPLFKDGTSNFGMYVLRKIYLEGKTLREINKDFKEDISDDYKELITSQIDSYAIKAYGIKYPETAFWNSFYPTRKEFPYEYKPRKASETKLAKEKAERTLSDILEKKNTPNPLPPKFKIDKTFKTKGKRMGEALIQGHGDFQQTERALRKQGITNAEELNFVSKYLGPIMSVALEKIHASEEMHTYFENYDSLNKSQKEKLNSYWRKNHYMRDLQSLAISDTIKLFYEAYGVDGNNEEFQELLDYAAEIKPKREQAKAEHQRKQLELEETFANYPEEPEKVEQEEENKSLPASLIMTEEELQAKAEQEALKHGAEIFTFTTPDGDTIKYVGKLDELYEEQMQKELGLLPRSLFKRFLKYSLKSPINTYEYKKAASLLANVPDIIADQLMPVDEVKKISSRINNEFCQKHISQIIAVEQAMAERLYEIHPNINFFSLNFMQLSMFATEKLNIKDWNEQDRLKLEKTYQKYSAPVTSKDEIRELNKAFINYLTCTDPDSTDWTHFGDFDDLYALIAKTLIMYPSEKNTVEKYLKNKNIMANYGGSARVLLDPNTPEEIKKTKAKLIFSYIIENSPDKSILNLLTKDAHYIDKYVKEEKLKMILLQNNYIL